MSKSSEVQKLLSELESGGTSKANNVVHLLAYINAQTEMGAVKKAIQALKLFFVEACQGGDLGPEKQVDGDHQEQGTRGFSHEEEGQVDAQKVFRQWLKRQYTLYTSALLSLLSTPDASPQLQISAVSALMEAVRCEMGVGVFSSSLYCRLVATITTSAAVKPEVFTLLFTRYFHYMDVSYYTLWSVKEIAQARCRAGVSTSKRDVGDLAPEDVARSLFDVLSNMPESDTLVLESTNGTAMGLVGKVSGAGRSGSALPRSWCGIEEAGEVKTAASRSESAKARRKRKQQELQEGGSSGPAIMYPAVPSSTWTNSKNLKRTFSDAWVSFLQMPLPDDIYRKVLLRLHSSVIPKMNNPLLLADFLTYALNQGGMVGMLALNGIFVLVTQHGLEYPAFYTKLYNLITADAFHAKHRAQFFKLADLFLSSALVPAYTAAAFAKRMARLAVSAPPAGAMTAIAFIHNLLRRHPACIILIDNPSHAKSKAGTVLTDIHTATEDDYHQEALGSSLVDLEEGCKIPSPSSNAPTHHPSRLGDVYDETQEDPAKSRAVESSLWELTCLRNHYCPQVAALCSILDKDLTDRTKTTEVDMDPLVSASYSSLFSQEVERRLKQVPLAFYQQPPTKLFDARDLSDFLGWKF
ncbi:hypothetical protein CEUSTIGMA_g9156.t1 [Chlamydomonas eustigma]|uniref:CCAAT-binding factor domain-containing protein n=1 Tax=Chlamydomonas eustigma TaxID=1157962 RepID=A0A250XF63_9CHLO|nr:hypothetical protein CEUSTIGMA_g9156.t1 [Chlamydomonas eustigma]|eukprot:GAX81728.1 hypothetical protein CEUSTIGMA_g9156.t1 [Chlamydomonas eustigma]